MALHRPEVPMGATLRQAAVAGRFYPNERSVLLAELQSYLSSPEPALSALGCIVPHAGYMYSGHVAGAVFARLQIPSRCIVMCPNHTGMGQPLSMMSEGTWQTPLGQVQIDAELADTLKQRYPLLSQDRDAHRAEHAIEVELPF